MRKTIILLAAVVVCFSAVLNVLAQGRPTPVNLKVTFDDNVSQVAGIRSDGMGPYFNGNQSVEAVLTEHGWFNFVSGARTVTAVYSDPVDGIVTPLPASETRTGVNIKTIVTSLKIQDMAVEQSQCVRLGVNIAYADAAKTIRTIGYQAGHGTITNTAWAFLTHPDADTWIIEVAPQTNCGADNSLDSVARIRDTKTKGKAVPDIDYGRYRMPLRLTLTRQ